MRRVKATWVAIAGYVSFAIMVAAIEMSDLATIAAAIAGMICFGIHEHMSRSRG